MPFSLVLQIGHAPLFWGKAFPECSREVVLDIEKTIPVPNPADPLKNPPPVPDHGPQDLPPRSPGDIPRPSPEGIPTDEPSSPPAHPFGPHDPIERRSRFLNDLP